MRTGELRVNVGKNGFDGAFDRVASIAAAHGGFVASSSTSSVDKAKAGELTVRIPSDRFDAARRDLAALGKVEYQALRGEDVSGQLVDYDARLKSLTAQEEALRGLLTRATAVGEVLEVQNSLFNVRQQIEQLTAQKRTWSRRRRWPPSRCRCSSPAPVSSPGRSRTTRAWPTPSSGRWTGRWPSSAG